MAFVDYFKELEDPRSHINRAHDLLDVIFLTIAAIASGAEGWQDIKDFGDKKLTWLRQYRKFKSGIPVDDTIARIISAINPDKFIECFLNWSNSLRVASGKEIIAIDGKTLRRCFAKGDRRNALHMISVWSDSNEIVLGQFKSQGKKNEIQTVLELLDLIDIKDATVTLDAMGSQKKIAQKIINCGGHYVLPLKENQKKLYQEAAAFIHKVEREKESGYQVQIKQETESDHGRIEVRHYKQIGITDWMSQAQGWAGAKTILLVRRERIIDEQSTQEEQIYLTSHDMDIEHVALATRNHWGVENKVHWHMDVTFKEDDCRIRRDNGGENMAAMRRFALNLAKLNPVKMSMRRKLKNCGWDDNFRAELLFA